MSTKEPNRLVAYNLRRARHRAGWNQAEAGERLHEFLGEAWSKTAWSSAEATYYSKGRVKVFSVDEVEAFARLFDLPIGWFFLPPVDDDPELHVGIKTAKSKALNPGEQLELVYPMDITDEAFRAIIERVAEMFADPASRTSIPTKYRSPIQVEIGKGLMSVIVATVREQIGDLSGEADHLEAVAAVLREADKRFANDVVSPRPKRRRKP